jgi:NAD(P)-dependent dehydrogenase (short-subunit alcohol dehydrogenase family)
MQSIAEPALAVVVGASGGIGRALVVGLRQDPCFAAVHALSRRPAGLALPGVEEGRLDLADEDSIEAAAALIANREPVRLVLVATGMLHRHGLQPEKTFKQARAEHLAESFAVNAIGPLLVAKHFLPLLPRKGKSIFAVLSARVGSIGDNQLGGWYGYRASKAALNMLVRCLAIEMARTHPDAVCVGLHPGTVDTDLSQPFQAGVPPSRLFRPEESAGRLLTVLDQLDHTDTGGCFAWDGSRIPP